METVVIEIQDNKALTILHSLKDINFIKFKDSSQDVKEKLLNLKPKNTSNTDSFFDLEGIWEDRDISIHKIRKKLWPKRK